MTAVPSAKRVLKFTVWANLAIILFATCLGLVKTGNPSRYFGEGRFTTGISCLQLLLVAFLAFRVFRLRGENRDRSRSGRWLWLLIAAGFAFLCADDALQIHESLDRRIHKVFHLQKTGISDRIDDAIIALYALIGIAVLWSFRKEMTQFKAMRRPLIQGFVIMGVSIVCDTLSNREDVILWIVHDMPLAKKIDGWLSVGDGAFSLLAEGLFVVAFYVALEIARTLGAPESRNLAAPSTSGKEAREHASEPV